MVLHDLLALQNFRGLEGGFQHPLSGLRGQQTSTRHLGDLERAVGQHPGRLDRGILRDAGQDQPFAKVATDRPDGLQANRGVLDRVGGHLGQQRHLSLDAVLAGDQTLVESGQGEEAQSRVDPPAVRVRRRGLFQNLGRRVRHPPVNPPSRVGFPVPRYPVFYSV